MIGVDIEAHADYPGTLLLQDARTLAGRQFAGAAAIVASAPCQEFTRHMLPWCKAKNPPPPDLSIIDAIFRLRDEARLAAGWDIPFLMENVRESQRYIGKADAHFGSRYLWGDVPAILPYAPISSKERLSSAAVAERSEIPFTLASYIARAFRPAN